MEVRVTPALSTLARPDEWGSQTSPLKGRGVDARFVFLHRYALGTNRA